MLKPLPVNISPSKYVVIPFLFISIICCSQQNMLNFTFSETPLPAVIKEISQQSNVNILYNPYILPVNHKISGIYIKSTLPQVLDSVLKNTAVSYKYYKGNIVLFKSNEDIIEKHSISQPDNQKENIQDIKRTTITDTVIYTIITYDTIVTELTNIVNVLDTVKTYDTIKVVKKIIQPLNYYKAWSKSFGVGISYSQGFFHSKFNDNNSQKDYNTILKSTIIEKNYNTIGISFLYKYNSWLFETGLAFSRMKYTFDYSGTINEIVTRTDTIDKYYTLDNETDTNWIYITEEKEVEVSIQKDVLSSLTYKYISVPLSIAYNKEFEKLAFEFKTGIYFNYYLGSKGYYYNTSQDIVMITDKLNAPNSKFNLDIFGAFSMDYPLNEKVHAYIQPCFGFTFLSAGNENIEYYTTNFKYGLQTGFRYFFN